MPLYAGAQTYPDYISTDINDFAGLLVDDEERERVKDRLVTLRQDTGIEMTVVTLPSQDAYAPRLTLEDFATGLFNHWGIGDSTRNDGIMVLVLPEDRAMRIELGAGFGQDWNHVAQRIVDEDFLPSFRDEDYQRGIEAGSAAVIERIALPFVEGRPAPAPPENTSLPWQTVPLFGGIILLFMLRGWVSDIFIRLRTCPKCGRKGTLRASRRTVQSATTNMTGRAERTVWCVACDYHDVSMITLARRTGSTSSGGFGGGRSGGGGASGRW
ncbi:YgcG family protein [Tateyamaria armeniaca]|uniref:YgcG family protein n=1 Tax=Tateyamaria armeniaca TaxID=2518930 RepID=A0ABW8UUZ7_9RHOB